MRRVLLYASVRASRALLPAQLAYEHTHSVAWGVLAGVATDCASVACDARPFLPTWSDFWLAAICLPWFLGSYWCQFVSHPRFARYGAELFALTATVMFATPLRG